MNYPIDEFNSKWEATKRIAHIMCEECGRDPEQIIECTHHDTIAMWNPLGTNYTYTTRAKQWESFIRAASIAYIGWKAVQRYMLVDA
jgi:hypothetical protein